VGSFPTFNGTSVTLLFAVYFHQLLSYSSTSPFIIHYRISFFLIYFSPVAGFKMPIFFLFQINIMTEAWLRFGLGKACIFCTYSYY